VAAEECKEQNRIYFGRYLFEIIQFCVGAFAFPSLNLLLEQEPAIELKLQEIAFDAQGRPILAPTSAMQQKKVGKDKEILEVEPGQIARTPKKTHMGLVTEYDFTVRMKKTSSNPTLKESLPETEQGVYLG
jgi:hypothetical protein